MFSLIHNEIVLMLLDVVDSVAIEIWVEAEVNSKISKKKYIIIQRFSHFNFIDQDPYLKQTCVITSGPWKGYNGVVKHATESTCRVQLEVCFNFNFF